jgi:hypothetical protein
MHCVKRNIGLRLFLVSACFLVIVLVQEED